MVLRVYYDCYDCYYYNCSTMFLFFVTKKAMTTIMIVILIDVFVNLLFALALTFVTMFSICFDSNLRWKSRRYFDLCAAQVARIS